jgi:hypothetical protein
MFPSCYACPQGLELQTTAVDASSIAWRGAGQGGRFDRGQSHADAQWAARRRLQLVGLLDEVPSVDHPPGGLEAAPAAPSDVPRPLELVER